MDVQLFIAIISAFATLAVAFGGFYFNERAKRIAEWQQKKFSHYQTLLNAIDDLAVYGRNKDKANQAFATACNTAALTASQEVITALMLFHDTVKYSSEKSCSAEVHDHALIELVLAIRKDIGLTKKDNRKTFIFHLVGSKR